MHSSSKTRIWRWLLGLCLLALAVVCQAQADRSYADGGKVTPEILAKAESGQPQRLIVWFDDDAIHARSLARQREQGFRRNSELEIEMLRLKELAALKSQVIAGTAGTDIQWVRDFETLPAAVVIATGSAGLATLLADPRVSAVSDASKPFPAGLPRRRQPGT